MLSTFSGLTLWDQMNLKSQISVSENIAFFQFIQAMGFRLAGAFMFEEPVFMSWLWFLIRPFLSKKLSERFHFLGTNYEKIDEIFPGALRALLPDCFPGGRVTDEEAARFNWVVKQYEDMHQQPS